MDAADLAFSELEKNLQAEIDAIETDYPDYDEYRYNLDAIGHDPFALISYLSAVYTEFTAAEVQGEIESLFDEMYELTLNPTTETRTGTRTVTDPETGEETEEEYEYEVSILEVTLTAKDLGVVAAGHMNEEQKEIYAFITKHTGWYSSFTHRLTFTGTTMYRAITAGASIRSRGRSSFTGALTLQCRQEPRSMRRWTAPSQQPLTMITTATMW